MSDSATVNRASFLLGLSTGVSLGEREAKALVNFADAKNPQAFLAEINKLDRLKAIRDAVKVAPPGIFASNAVELVVARMNSVINGDSPAATSNSNPIASDDFNADED